MNELQLDYFNYIMDTIGSKSMPYNQLFRYLYDVPFVAMLDMDNNRINDAIDFRYRFGDMYGYTTETIKSYLDIRECSVLEMMFALAFRCEEQIMSDSSCGNRTGEWFWIMIANLGLGSMTDANFDERYVLMVVNRLINREYGPHGEGGLFTVHNKQQDLRNVEIWYQLMWYLDENFPLNL